MTDTENIKMVNDTIETIKNIKWMIEKCQITEREKNILQKFQQEIYKEMINKLSFVHKK
ncbi:protein of unknown function [endosymbiont DhMRE of Dentiscutata heterogama]|uniref:hypothetical protein n=1 Tax=endosymbiont DhMRE of Dentiscutata heterogama TaxID=1609546 RepID=UPI000629D30D|nr:hypothetical protein [endosymbiont DhMRE of Dentiscutata heterogama]CFW92984.1 protein of unknown function [endosymbiont DhMRE of Dentiscutata heterogama]